MKRVSLTDGSGKWFDEDRVQDKWRSAGNWGDFNVLRQILYLTAGGRWVLQFVPTRDSEQTSREGVTDGAAAEWLVDNDYTLPEALVAVAAKSEI